MGAVQSIAQYQSQAAAAAASERAYQEQRNLNQEAANRAYQQTQLKLKGEMEQASQKAEQLLTQRLQAQGTTLSYGRSGQSIGALLADAQRVEGKDLGTLGMNLAYANQDYFFGMENVFNQQRSANIQAASQRQPASSIGGLILGIAGSALQGVSTGMSMSAQSAGGGGGGSTPSVTPYPSGGLPNHYTGGITAPTLPGNPYTYRRS